MRTNMYKYRTGEAGWLSLVHLSSFFESAHAFLPYCLLSTYLLHYV